MSLGVPLKAGAGSFSINGTISPEPAGLAGASAATAFEPEAKFRRTNNTSEPPIASGRTQFRDFFIALIVTTYNRTLSRDKSQPVSKRVAVSEGPLLVH